MDGLFAKLFPKMKPIPGKEQSYELREGIILNRMLEEAYCLFGYKVTRVDEFSPEITVREEIENSLRSQKRLEQLTEEYKKSMKNVNDISNCKSL